MDKDIKKIDLPPLKESDFYIQPSTNGTAKSYIEKFTKSILDQSNDYPEPPAIISLKHGEDIYPFLTSKSFSLWQGKQKSKKTLTIAIMVAAYIRHTLGIDDIDFTGNGNGVVLWFDCEQGQSYAARTMKLILKLAGVDKCDRLIFSEIRECTPRERMSIIKAGIESTKGVSLVIIDGIVDLMQDFMEAAEGHFVITELLIWCSIFNVHIAGVLHQNKADNNARAHVGSIGSQKCELEISTKVDPEDKARSIVECVNSRGLPFESFAIRWDKGQLPRIDQEWQPVADKKEVNSLREYDKAKDIVKNVFKPLKHLSHTEAVDEIMNLTKKSEATAKRYLKQYASWKMVERGSDGNYRIKL